ncbi:MAG TPA: AAA family ATPase [Pseudonocardia sp.]|nr:AAA family ATPase [Pseudonocardia sp.]
MSLLVVLAGLPGTGKSALTRPLAQRLGAALVVVDLLEDAMLRAGVSADQPTGFAAYVAAEVVAEDALAAGVPVVVDAVNAVTPARARWRALGERRGVPRAVVEVTCSDPDVHRARLEGRRRGWRCASRPGRTCRPGATRRGRSRCCGSTRSATPRPTSRRHWRTCALLPGQGLSCKSVRSDDVVAGTLIAG